MNIEFQLGGLLIVLLLLILYNSKKSLNLYSERIFVCIMFVAAFMLFSDIVSVWAITNRDELPSVFVNFICKLYVSLLVYEECLFLVYILYDVLGEKKHRKYTSIILLIAFLESIVIFLLPIKMYHNGRTVFTYGPAAILTYIFVAIYMISSIVVAICGKNRIYPRRRFAFLLCIVLWLVAAVIQFIKSEMLVVGIAASLGIIVLYIMLENPESNIDQKIGCFNSFALTKFLNQLFENGTEFDVAFFSMEEIGEKEENYIKSIVKDIQSYDDIYIFKSLNTNFFIITKTKGKFQGVIKGIEAEYENYPERYNDKKVFLMENAQRINSAGETEALFNYLDEKLKSGKEGPYITVTDDMLSEFNSRNEMIDEIKNALAEDRVEIFLQPIFSVYTQKFTSAEVLTRIRRRDGSLIPPGLFIPVAEDSGLIISLGKRIFEKTCQFIDVCKPYQKGVDYFEVNLSVIQCEQASLADELIDIMEKNNIDAGMINLEITETATMDSKKKILKNVDKLLQRGCMFSLDDFGKGQSNLMYVVDMPVSVIKLDYDMTKAFATVPKAKSVVRSVVIMAHEMGLAVVAEGIETEEELDNMVSMNIDYIQGYYFSKPIPTNEYMQFIEENN